MGRPKGYIQSIEEREKRSKSLKNYYKNNYHKGGFKKGIIPWNKGKTRKYWMNEQQIENMKKTQFKKGIALRKGKHQIAWNKGKKTGLIPKTSFKKGERMGLLHHNWKGGVSNINSKIRHSVEYKLWRKSVFERDDYTCIWCRQRGGIIHADHIKPFAFFPELRFAIDNGRTLCFKCHKKTDTYLKRIYT